MDVYYAFSSAFFASYFDFSGLIPLSLSSFLSLVISTKRSTIIVFLLSREFMRESMYLPCPPPSLSIHLIHNLVKHILDTLNIIMNVLNMILHYLITFTILCSNLTLLALLPIGSVEDQDAHKNCLQRHYERELINVPMLHDPERPEQNVQQQKQGCSEPFSCKVSQLFSLVIDFSEFFSNFDHPFSPMTGRIGQSEFNCPILFYHWEGDYSVPAANAL